MSTGFDSAMVAAALRVLVIDDDSFARMVMYTMLEDAARKLDLQITVAVAASGDEAINVCQESEAFDLVLLDYFSARAPA